ncbi:MAG: IS1595 family transposase [Collimonas pratensis]|uniref:IS1595 family transposase n=1 Tax=Collimonas pratensis TaxID=279113 RepID=UPI003C70C376
MKADKPLPESLTLDNILQNFGTDEKARLFLEKWLWPEGIVCPRCGSRDPERVYRMTGKSTRPGLCNCKDCRRQFSVTVGTIFEDSHIPLRKWLVAWYLISSSKKGMSSLQFQRILDLGSYRTALFMTHRIRHAMKETIFPEKMKGTVEVDECYFGPNTHKQGFHKNEKTAVVALVERETGQRRSVVVDFLTAKDLHEAVRQNVEPGSTINTDDLAAYVALGEDFRHKSVRHAKTYKKKAEYWRKEGDEVVTTNYVESSFSLLRRAVTGTFHNISRKHLHLYVAEFDARFNRRKISDGERTVDTLQMAKGKRLTYKPLVGKTV